MKYSSDILLHFVGRGRRSDPVATIDACFGILNQGFRFSNQTVDLGREIGSDELRLDAQAVCFTDIPLRLSAPHVARYGTCAIGVPKHLVKTWGGNPVIYLVDAKVSAKAKPRADFRGFFGHEVATILKMLIIPEFREAIARVNPDHWVSGFNAMSTAQQKSLSDTLNKILIPFLKPIFDLGPDVDSEDESSRRDRYYMEREWRVALWSELIENAEQNRGLVSKIGTEFYLPIPRSEVSIVVVPNRWCRLELTKRLLGSGWAQEELPSIVEYPSTLDL